MLLGIASVLSFGVAALVCGLTGAFAGLGWLWILPLVFVGTFLLCAALWFLLLMCIIWSVDMEKEQTEDNRFSRRVIGLTIDALVVLLRIRIRVEGLEKLPKEGRFMLVCNHLHISDPVVLLKVFKKRQLAFISKRENDANKITGPLLRSILCQPINRENDREALKTILNCIRLLKEDKVSIAVFPEGYIKDDGLMHPFRGGVFKIAQKAKVPVVVCTMRNTQYLFENLKKLRPAHIELHLVGVIPVEQLEGRTAIDVSNQAYEMMARDLGPELVWQENREEA